jgi:hypothetical protein
MGQLIFNMVTVGLYQPGGLPFEQFFKGSKGANRFKCPYLLKEMFDPNSFCIG